MKVDDIQLHRPVRMQVDLSSPPGVPAPVPPENLWIRKPGAERKMEAMVDGGLFFLHLAYPWPGEEDLSLSLEFIRLASNRGVSVSVITEGGLLPAGDLFEAGAGEVLFDLTPSAHAGEDLKKTAGELLLQAGHTGAPMRTGFLLFAGPGETALLMEFLLACGERGAGIVELPAPPLIYYPPREAGRGLLKPEDYRQLEEHLGEQSEVLSSIEDLRVHDIILWTMIQRNGGFPGGRFSGFKGCQAAGALGYLKADGTLYPCSALDMPLGRVEDLTDEGFWQRENVRGVREKIQDRMRSCRDCPAMETCRGGCPGVSLADSGSWEGGDSLCRFFEDLVRAD